MVSKRKAKIAKKEYRLKASAAKLSNKRLNRLAKQGKLKRILGKKKLKSIVGNRVHPTDRNSYKSEDDENVVDTDDIPLEEADYEYFARPGRDFSFLSTLSANERKDGRRRRSSGDGDNLEEDYEQRLSKRKRSDDDEVEVRSLLPIKCKDMGVIRRTIEITKPKKMEECAEEMDTELSELSPTPAEMSLTPADPSLTPAEAFIHRQMQVAEAKEQIATLCTAVISSPQDNVGKLKTLRSFIDVSDGNVPVTVCKLAMLSLMEVLKDVLPEYRLRVFTNAEKHQKMKKETKKLVGFEEALLSNYRHYLESLENLATGKPVSNKSKWNQKSKRDLSTEATKSLRTVAVRCLCELLIARPHFNFRNNIIAIVVPFLVKQNKQMSDMVCEYVRRLFVEDKAGDVTLEVVRLIGRLVKAKKFSVHPKVLATFLSLKIKEVDRSENSKKPVKMSRQERLKRFSKRERKRQKQTAHLEKELVDAAVEDNAKLRLRLNTEIINTIFLTYFRILKIGRRSKLLSVVLEGLSMFAHLINVSFFDDLFAVMTDLVDNGDLTYRESLHCIQTAFSLLSGFGASLNIDPMRFYTHLYKTLFHLHAGRSAGDLPIALHCLDALIGKRRRQVPMTRVFAFVKRLSTLALQMDCHGSLALMALISNIMSEHPKCRELLDCDGCGSGVFLAELEQPDLCNAQGTCLFEAHLLTRSYHPVVRQYARFLLKRSDASQPSSLPPALARSTPAELFAAYDPTALDFTSMLKPVSSATKQQKSLSSNICRMPSTDLMVTDDNVETSVDFYADVSARTSSSKKP